MNVKHATTVLAVTDLQRAIGFYADKLGFEVEFRFDHYAGLRYGNCHIGLSGPGDPRQRQPGSGELYVSCDEVDAYHNMIVSGGVEPDEVLQDRDYGMRDFAVRDPDGNRITFGVSAKRA